MGMDKEIMEALGIEQNKAGDYRTRVSEAYKEKKNNTLMKAVKKASKQYPKMDREISSVITAVFANRNIADYYSGLIGQDNNLDDLLIDQIAKYGKQSRLEPKDAVKDDTVMINSILASYGSLDSYKERLLEEIKTWNDVFSKVEKAGSLSLFGLGAQIIQAVGYHDKGHAKIYSSLTKAVNDAGMTLGDMGDFGKSLVMEYAKINGRDIKRYEKLNK